MPVAAHDQNNRPTIICVSLNDGTTIVPAKINPANHCLKIDDNTTGSDNGNNGGNAMLDENGVAVWMAESSDGSGNLIEVYADGGIYVDSN